MVRSFSSSVTMIKFPLDKRAAETSGACWVHFICNYTDRAMVSKVLLELVEPGPGWGGTEAAAVIAVLQAYKGFPPYRGRGRGIMLTLGSSQEALSPLCKPS